MLGENDWSLISMQPTAEASVEQYLGHNKFISVEQSSKSKTGETCT